MFGNFNTTPNFLVTDGGCNNGWGNGDGWGWILLLALFGGWGFGGNGWGNGRGNNCCCNNNVAGEVQRGFDTQTVVSKLDGINGGICSLGYDQLAQMNGINTNILQTGFGIQQAINNDTVSGMQNTNALQTQISDCCCKNQTGQMQIINQMDKNACALGNNVHQTGDAIINNQNNGFNMLNQTIKDGFCNLEMREMARENAALRQQVNDSNRDAALQGTANYIINTVNPRSQPAYITCNPNTGNIWPCGTNPFSNNCWSNCGSSCGCCA